MVRTALVALALALATPAAAQDGRDDRGEVVALGTTGTVVLFWSIDDPGAAAQLATLSTLAASGMAVLAVNTDSATVQARVRPHLRRLGLVDLRTAHDRDGAFRAAYRASTGEAVVVQPVVVDRVVWRGTDLDALVPAPLPHDPITADAAPR